MIVYYIIYKIIYYNINMIDYIIICTGDTGLEIAPGKDVDQDPDL